MKLGQKAFIFISLLVLSACAPMCGQPGDAITMEAKPRSDPVLHRGWMSYTEVNDICDMTFDPDGNLWTVDKQGVVRWNLSEGTYTRYTSEHGLLGNEVTAIAASPNGTLWFGFANVNGVSYFDGERWGAYIPEQDLVRDVVTSIAAAPDGTVWVSTLYGGVSHFDEKTWTRYTRADGLRKDWVKSVTITPDGTLAWKQWFCHAS